MNSRSKMHTVIDTIFQNNRGILAADESIGTISKRMATINIESTPENRRIWRNLLFSTPGIEKYIGGVILFEETLYQKTDDGTLIPDYLKHKNITPGIKVDNGAYLMPEFSNEKISYGLDNLSKRLVDYKNAGAEFAKWRAVIKIGDQIPTETCIRSNAEVLARYAAICQDQQLVPIVEPEVLIDGQHTIDTCERVTTDVLYELFYLLHKHNVIIEDCILKPNMLLPGKDSPLQCSDEEVASATLRTLYRSVPSAVPAIAFLSGGQDTIDATRRLNQINTHEHLPWIISFSFSRALQDPVMKTWRGRNETTAESQKILLHRARCNSIARQGTYTFSCESKI